ncbi:MAG: DNA repair protein RadA [Parcubacteria group bacterium CG_4_9_14_0_2_um_filter_41_8]|nr:MAG: DNA repair protein RadA [Parcubacteria group bacterium CG_4_9_14_0_2_um_filter_41_8]
MSLYICSHCDSQYSKWQGQCDECNKWGTIAEESEHASLPTESVSIASSTPLERIPIAIQEINNVLGGGLVPGSFVLLAGDPGIGKSTLVLQIACALISPPCTQGNSSKISPPCTQGDSSKISPPVHRGGLRGGSSASVLYIAGEESPDQIALRLNRLNASSQNLRFLANTSVKSIIANIKKHKPDLVIVDSIQTIFDEDIDGTSGNVNQVRACASQLLQIAKQENIPIIVIGHVTKEGYAAGPQTLAHMVDVVLYLEGDRFHEHRLLRSTKNRFGPTNQVGVFSMSENGLQEVKNPSEMFLSGQRGAIAGSVVSVVMEGSRPFLIEIQALTNKTSYGYPKRAVSGFDLSRLELLIAVLARRAGLKLDNQDVFLNIVSGLKVKDPGLDLAAALAIASSLSNQAMPQKSVALGEIGLAGEVRPVAHFAHRVEEAKRLGFEKIYGPSLSLRATGGSEAIPSINQISTLAEMLEILGIKKEQ